MKREHYLILFLTLIFLAGVRIGISAPVIKIKAHLETRPGSFSGYCPVTVYFFGYIEVNRACAVRYKFLMSNGKSTPQRSLEFFKAEKQYVSYSWTLNTPYSGWAAIEAQTVSPVFKTRSNNATFEVSCILRPQITNVERNPAYREHQQDEIVIHGVHLHEPAGKIRKILCDGAVVHTSNMRPGGYPDTQIIFGMDPSSIIAWDHVYRFSIEEDGIVISNIFQVRFPILISLVSPASATPGTMVTIWGFNLGSHAGKVLKLGPYVFTDVLSWNDRKILATVPSATAGRYEIYIQRGSEVISKGLMGKNILTVLIP